MDGRAHGRADGRPGVGLGSTSGTTGAGTGPGQGPDAGARVGADAGARAETGARAGAAPVVAFVLALAVALALAAGAAGCGGTNGAPNGQPGAGGRKAGSGSPSGTATSPGGGSGPAAVPSAAALRSALLTAHDIGLGTTVDPSSIGGASIKGCEPLAGTLNATMAAASRPGQQAASSGFAGGGTGPFVAEGLTTKAPGPLAADYARTRASLSACRSLTLSTGGTHLKFALTPVAFGGAGTTAARLDAKLQGFGVKGYLAMRRVGPVVLSYYFFALGGGTSQVASSYYEQAVAKAGRVLAASAG